MEGVTHLISRLMRPAPRLPRDDMEDVPVLGVAARRVPSASSSSNISSSKPSSRASASSRPTNVMPGRPTQLSRGPYHWPLKRPPGGSASRMRVPQPCEIARGSQSGMAKLEFTRLQADRQRHVLQARHDRRDVAAGRQVRAPASWRSASGSASTATTLQPRRRISIDVAAVAAAEIDRRAHPVAVRRNASSAANSVRRGGRSRSLLVVGRPAG